MRLCRRCRVRTNSTARESVSSAFFALGVSSAAFASAFYDAVRTRAPHEALAAAQRTLLHDPRYARFSAPRYWAPYVIAGSGRAGAQTASRPSVQ